MIFLFLFLEIQLNLGLIQPAVRKFSFGLDLLVSDLSIITLKIAAKPIKKHRVNKVQYQFLNSFLRFLPFRPFFLLRTLLGAINSSKNFFLLC